MTQKIADWLQNHKLSSHAIALAILGFFAAYTGDKVFADYVNGLLAHYPKVLSGLGTASGLYLLYRQSQKGKP